MSMSQSFFPLQQVRGQVVSSSAAADDQTLVFSCQPKVSLSFYQEPGKTRIYSSLQRTDLFKLLDFWMSFFMTMSTQLVRSNPLTLSSSNLHQQNPFCVSGHGTQWWGSACFCHKLDWQCPDLLRTKRIGSNWTFSTKPRQFLGTSFTLTWLRNLFDDHGCGYVMTCYNNLRQWLLPGETCPGQGMRQSVISGCYWVIVTHFTFYSSYPRNGKWHQGSYWHEWWGVCLKLSVY